MKEIVCILFGAAIVVLFNIHLIPTSQYNVVVRTENGIGSGVVYGSNILTAWHVVSGATNIIVQVGNSHTVATVCYTDELNDVVVLKPVVSIKTKYWKMTEVCVSDRVTLYSNPQGIENVYSEGIVAKSTLNKIVIDMPILPGSSGGAVMKDGKLVGIVLGYIKDSSFTLITPSDVLPPQD